jgi:hypothetical protein
MRLLLFASLVGFVAGDSMGTFWIKHKYDSSCEKTRCYILPSETADVLVVGSIGHREILGPFTVSAGTVTQTVMTSQEIEDALRERGWGRGCEPRRPFPSPTFPPVSPVPPVQPKKHNSKSDFCVKQSTFILLVCSAFAVGATVSASAILCWWRQTPKESLYELGEMPPQVVRATAGALSRPG